MSKRVVVAMSGGVDSSVAAYLIKEAGYEAIGVTMQVYDHSDDTKHRFGSCCGLSDYDDARIVAEKLDIPFYLLDFENTFQREVIDNFVQEYRRGRTPIPCIHCNNKVKFHHLYNKAKELGAQFVATGHYAIVNKESDGRLHLRRSKDNLKDQTYFLFGLDQEQLGHTLFPVGNLTKGEVRDIARKLNLRTAEKDESVGICFVPDKDYARFVEKQLPEVKTTKGEIVTTDGRIIANHDGIHHFTVGQRHGLGIATGAPSYVISISPETNRVVVGNEEEVLFDGLTATGLNWINVIPENVTPAECHSGISHPDESRDQKIPASAGMTNAVIPTFSSSPAAKRRGDLPCVTPTFSSSPAAKRRGDLPCVIPAEAGIHCKIRYRSPDIPCSIESIDEKEIKVTFKTPYRAVTPGQAVVFYSDDECIGGGWIESGFKSCRSLS